LRAKKGKYWRPPVLTPAQRAELFARQGECCVVCQEPMVLAAAQIEHSHRTNRLRSLAHKSCNQKLRGYRDSPKRIRQELAWLKLALAYLRRPPAKGV
jgi:hypothetical protein